MPAGLIENEDRVSAGGYSCSDLVEMKLHGFGVAERQNEGGAGSMFGAPTVPRRLVRLIYDSRRQEARPLWVHTHKGRRRFPALIPAAPKSYGTKR